ncbi:MAG: 23S rRNA (adenine(2503)-C(2))-methyltransferase RlmN [Patescibacteria group bacterium]
MNLYKISQELKDEPAYRTRQAYAAVFQQLVGSWAEVTGFPIALRERLEQNCPLAIPAAVSPSNGGRVQKAVVTLGDGNVVEAVLMRHPGDRNTVCVSSQVGCPLGCTFCATGRRGFTRNLKSDEIVMQVVLFGRYLKRLQQRVTNVVFMGMGEPFLNYDQVLGAVREINSPDRLSIGARHISISTAGIITGIHRLAAEPLQVNLAISLHAPTDELRERIMPVNRQYPIRAVLMATADYIRKTKRRVMVEYLLISGVNDSPAHADTLAAVLQRYLPELNFVNLISYNPTGVFRSPSAAEAQRFSRQLRERHVAVVERFRFGREVDGACGQLAGRPKR